MKPPFGIPYLLFSEAVIDPAQDAPPAGGQQQQPPADPPARPEWFPEKYWKDGGPEDYQRFGEGHRNLEKSFHERKAADLPADAKGYQLKPEKLPEGVNWSDETEAKMAESFHKAGIGAAQAKAIAGTWMELEAANLEAAMKVYTDQKAATRAALVEQWGGEEKFNARVEAITGLVTGALGEDPQDVELFSNPRILGLLGKVSDLLGEDAQAALKNSVAPGNSFAGGEQLAAKIMGDPSHPEHKLYQEGEPNTVAKVMRLLSAGS